MAKQDSRSSFWTSLPGILTGVAALITAISGLAIWHTKSNSQPAPAPAIQQPAQPQPSQPQAVEPAKAEPTKNAVAIGTEAFAPTTKGPAVPIGSEQWCAEKYNEWKDKKQQDGMDDAGLRKQITQAHCNQFGFKLGRVKEKQ